MRLRSSAVVLLVLAAVTACAPRLSPVSSAAVVPAQPVPAAAPVVNAFSPASISADSPAMAEVAGISDAAPGDSSITLLPDSLSASPFGVLGQQLAEPAVLAAAPEDPAVESRANALRMSVPFRTQKDGDRFQGSNCGPATLSMVLDAFGMQHGNAELRLLTHTYQGTVGARTGTALQHMAHVAADYGLEPRGLYQRPDGSSAKDGFARWTVDDIRDEVLAGRPVIPLVKFRLLPGHEDSPFRADHYVVVYGVDGDSFLYHDPIYDSQWEGGARWMSAETLAAAMKPTLVPQQAVSFGPGSHASLPTA